MGVGLGGFLDGIVLHQILQWHHLLTDEGDFSMDAVQTQGQHGGGRVLPLRGLGCSGSGMMVTINAWQRRKLAPSWRSHFGMLLVGWGVFNLVEGVIDHQILGIHHVRDDLGGPMSWDIGFLVFSALLVLVGIALSRSGERAVDRVGGHGTSN
jgi:uncharacterized membrane protein